MVRDLIVYLVVWLLQTGLSPLSIKHHTYPRIKGCKPSPCKSGDREGSVACMKNRWAELEGCRTVKNDNPLVS